MKTKIFIIVLALFATVISCKKPEKGEAGPAGTNGTNGTNGNANVKVFYFGKDSIESTRVVINYALPSSVTSNMMDSSAVLVYYSAYGYWYSVPGLGINGNYMTRVYSVGNVVVMKIADPDGTAYSGAKYILDKTKIVVIPSSDFKGFRKAPVEFNNYEATMKYYGLPLN